MRFAYMAEEHGVFGPALIRAELLRGASVLCRHQLLGHRLAVGAGVTVFAPAFCQVVLKEELTAWRRGRRQVTTPTPLQDQACMETVTCVQKVFCQPAQAPEECVPTVTAEEAVFVVDPPGISADLFRLTVFTRGCHKVGFLELLRTVHATHKHQLVLHTHSWWK